MWAIQEVDGLHLETLMHIMAIAQNNGVIIKVESIYTMYCKNNQWQFLKNSQRIPKEFPQIFWNEETALQQMQ